MTFAALLVCSSLASAETLSVGPAGSGFEFEEIGLAIAAAAPGDVITIAPGFYAKANGLDIDKPLTLIGGGSDVTRFTSLPNNPFDQPLPLYVHDLEPGEEVRVIGLELVPGSLGNLGPTIAVIADCAGPVVLSDVAGIGSYGAFGGIGLLLVFRSEQVLLDACDLNAGSSNSSVGPTGPALNIEDSNLHINASAIFGGTGVQILGNGVPSDGTPAIVATHSEVRLSNSQLNGGSGSDYIAFFDLGNPNANPEATPGLGASAIQAVGSTIFIRGGSSTTIQGGAGGQNLVATTPLYSSGGSAVSLDSDSLVSRTPGLALVPGLDGDGAGNAPAIDGSGTVVPVAINLAQLTITPSVAGLGTPVSFNLGGEAGGIYFTFFSFEQGPAVGFTGIPGLSVLPLGSLSSLPSKSLGAKGAAQLGIHVPNSISLAGSSLLMQGIALAPDATFSFSAPAQVAIVQ